MKAYLVERTIFGEKASKIQLLTKIFYQACRVQI